MSFFFRIPWFLQEILSKYACLIPSDVVIMTKMNQFFTFGNCILVLRELLPFNFSSNTVQCDSSFGK